MKHALPCLVVIALMLSGGMAQAGKKSITFLGVGLTAPHLPKSFRTYWKTGFNAGLGFGQWINTTLSGLVDIEFHKLYFNEAKMLSDLDLGDRNISVTAASTHILSIMPGLKQEMTSEEEDVIPYLICGIGFQRFASGEIRISDENQSLKLTGDVETSLFGSAGFGVDFSLGRNSLLFIQPSYNIAFTKDERIRYIPVKIGISSKYTNGNKKEGIP